MNESQYSEALLRVLEFMQRLERTSPSELIRRACAELGPERTADLLVLAATASGLLRLRRAGTADLPAEVARAFDERCTRILQDALRSAVDILLCKQPTS